MFPPSHLSDESAALVGVERHRLGIGSCHDVECLGLDGQSLELSAPSLHVYMLCGEHTVEVHHLDMDQRRCASEEYVAAGVVLVVESFLVHESGEATYVLQYKRAVGERVVVDKVVEGISGGRLF